MSWTALREEFPVTQRWAFFDHAAVSPLPRRTRAALCAWADDLMDHGVVSDPHWVRRVAEVRTLAGRLLNADPLDVAFIKNTSEGIGFIAEGIRWQPGDNVVTAQEEYPANLYPWMNLAERGVEVRMVQSRGPRVEIDDLRQAIDNRTRLLTLSFVEYSSGFRNDLDAVGQLCREKGIRFLVDAIQGLGVFPVDVQRTPIDFLAADGHKWLLGPEGAGIIYIRRERLNELRTVSVGWNSVVNSRDFSRLDFRLKPHAGRWENGTLNHSGITGLGASLELLLELGIPQVRERIRDLTDHLCTAAVRQGIAVFSSRVGEDWSGIVSLCVSGDLQALKQRCRAEGIIVNHRAGRLRVSPHCYNTHDELDRLLHLLTH